MEIIIVTKKGKIIKLDAKAIPPQLLVKGIKLDKGDSVAAVATSK